MMRMLHSFFALAWAVGPARAMTYTQEKVNNKTCDVVAWTDAGGKARSVALVRADGDVHGFNGGYIERYTYFVGDTQHTGVSWNQAQEGVSGLGCAINHHDNTAASSKKLTNAKSEFLLKGENHCLWRFKGDSPAKGKTIGITLDYFISEGKNEILWASSYDSSALKDGEATWDARGPYVQFDWDGDGHFYDGKISGIRWGDKFKFKTVNYVFGHPEQNTWDYSQPNTIPYMLLWKDAALGDVELGVVQTQPWEIQDAGGYWWAKNWEKTGTGMPENWNCPFQLNAYEKYSSEKMAWGANYGYVGSSKYDVLGYKRKASGYPHQGYAVLIVLGRTGDAGTDKAIASMEAVQKTKLSASLGTIVLKGPQHADLSGDAEYKPAGWNHVHGTWAVSAAENGAAFTIAVSTGALSRPTFEIQNYSAKALGVKLNGTVLAAGKDFAASVDEKGRKVYVTLLKNVSGDKNEVEIK